MSASSRPTAFLAAASAMAKLAATVDLPTPPLPLATAMICLTPGRTIFCAAPGPKCGGGIAFDCSLMQLFLIQSQQLLERIDAGILAIIQVDFLGVTTNRRT